MGRDDGFTLAGATTITTKSGASKSSKKWLEDLCEDVTLERLYICDRVLNSKDQLDLEIEKRMDAVQSSATQEVRAEMRFQKAFEYSGMHVDDYIELGLGPEDFQVILDELDEDGV